MYKKKLGSCGEQLVAAYLTQKHFTILAHNFRQRDGEIDIIARKEDMIVFVEVKTRCNPLIDPAEVITPSKQRKIARTAHIFIAQHMVYNTTCRFDVALVTGQGADATIAYIPDAFQVSEYA